MTYRPCLVTAGGLQGELERLDRQAAFGFSAELTALLDLGLADGQRLVDLGCGSGAFTSRLRDALPGLDVIGADVDADLLSFVAAPVVLLDQSPAEEELTGSVDLVLIRYVAQHLDATSREQLWQRAWRFLRPGGHVVVIDVDDADWGFVDPPAPALAPIFRRMGQSPGVADRRVMTKLGPELRATGFSRVTSSVLKVSSATTPVEDFRVHLGPERYAGAVVDGTVTLPELAAISARWNRLVKDPHATLEIHLHLLTGSRPVVPPPERNLE